MSMSETSNASSTSEATTTDRHCKSVREWSERSRTEAMVAGFVIGCFLVVAVVEAMVSKDLKGSVVTLIAAGIAAGVAALYSRSSGRAAEQLNVVYGRQYQMDMFNQMKCLQGAVQQSTRSPHIRDTALAQETELTRPVAELEKAADANHTRLVSEWLESMTTIATRPIEAARTERR